MLELIAALDAAAAPGEGPLNPHFAAARDGELARSSLDVSLAADQLGFSAQVPLPAGVKLTLDALR